ncbi:MAG: tetratricopeptide repeat protein [Cytophagales bacterium]|nr:tetratricopeptide repeat protein [Cytophagales bacterium]
MHKKLSLFVCVLLVAVSVSFAQKGKKGKKTTLRDRTENSDLKAESALIEAEKQLILENYTKSYELFLVALELNPSSAAIHYKLAEVLVKTSETEKALPYAEKARDIDPENKYYHLLAAEIHKSMGNLQKSAEIYEDLVNKIEGTQQYLYELAQLYQYQNEFAKALEAYERAEGYYGLSEAVLYEKQKIYLKQGNLDQLVSDWDELIKEAPTEYRYRFKVAEILISNGRYEQARERLLIVRNDESKVAQVDLLLSEIERKQGNLPQSLNLLETPLESSDIAISRKLQLLGGFLSYLPNEDVEKELMNRTRILAEKYPEEYQAQAFAGDVLYQIDEKESAVGYYLKAIKLSPGNFSVWQNVINLELQLSEFDSMVAHSETALEYFPNQAIFYFFNGLGNYVQKNYRAAVNALETGKKYTSDPSLLGEFYGQLGDAYNALQNHKKSDESYEAALERNPKNDHVLNNYSYFLSLRKEKLELAISMCERLLKLQPDNPTYLDTYGWVLYVSEEYKEAKKYLKRAVELDDSDGTVLEHYGDVLFRLGEVAEAVIQWEKASRTDEASDQIEQKINDRQIYE